MNNVAARHADCLMDSPESWQCSEKVVRRAVLLTYDLGLKSISSDAFCTLSAVRVPRRRKIDVAKSISTMTRPPITLNEPDSARPRSLSACRQLQ